MTTTYLKNAQRKALARQAARELLDSGTPFQALGLKAVAAHLGWSLGTLHRAYSIASTLLNDLLMQRQTMLTGHYSGPDYVTLD